MLKKSVFGLTATAFISILVMSLPGCGGGGGGGAAATTPVTPALANFYVNSTTGNNASAVLGTAPFKTIASAVQYASAVAATSGANIYVASGVYSAASGEVFPIKLTSGENLIGDIAHKGMGASGVMPATTIAGNGNGAGIYPNPPGTVVLGVNICNCQAAVLVPAGVTGASIKGFNIGGGWDYDIMVDNASATIDSNTTAQMAGGWGNDIGVFRAANVTISNNVLTDDHWYAHLLIADNAKVTARNNTIPAANIVNSILVWGGSTAASSPSADLGTAGSPGGNTIQGGVSVVGLYIVNSAKKVNASGNTWRPVQLANASGVYPVGASAVTATPWVGGNNYAIVAASGVQF